MAHIRYATAEIARALRTAPSVQEAMRMVGLRGGAFYKRCNNPKYPELKPLLQACAQRGRVLGDRGRHESANQLAGGETR